MYVIAHIYLLVMTGYCTGAIICPSYSADLSNSRMHCGQNGCIGALNTKSNSALDPIRRHHIDPRHVGELGN
jgi:hypothetical protein